MSECSVYKKELLSLPLEHILGTRDYKCDVASDSLRYAFCYAYPPPPPESLFSI